MAAMGEGRSLGRIRLQPDWSTVACFCIVVLLAALDARAASMLDPTGRFTIQWWTSEDGLPDTWVTGVAVAPDGSVFCCSRERLTRFDGLAFEAVPTTLTKPLHDAIGHFWSIGFDGEGRLWVQGGRAVARLGAGQNPSYPKAWTVYRLSSGKIFGLSFGRDGRPIIVGPDLLAAFNGQRLVQFLPGTDDDESCQWRYGGTCPADGDIWLWGTRPGKRRLFRRRVPADASALSFLTPEADAIGTAVISVGFGPSGSWALLPDGIALHQNGTWNKIPPALPDPDYRISGKITESNDGTVWISDHTGLLACRDGRIETAIEGVPGFSSFTNHLVADGNGGVWAACAGGLLAVRRSSVQVRSIDECRAVFVRHDGTLLVGSPGAVTAYDAASGSAAAMAEPSQGRLIATLPKEAVPTSILETADGRIWVGTRSSFILRIEEGQVNQVTKPDKHFRELRSIHALALDTEGRVWAGTANGLAVHDPRSDQFRIVAGDESPLHAYVIGLAAEADGGILAATVGRGVVRIGPNECIEQIVKAVDLPGRRSIAIHRDSRGTLWLGGDRGLLGVSPAGAMVLHTTASGLVEDAVRQISEDTRGRLWVATRDGHVQGLLLDSLERLAAGRAQVVRGIVLGPLDGLGNGECIGGILEQSAEKNRGGHSPAGRERILVPMSRGVAVIAPEHLATSQASTPPAIRPDPRVTWGFFFSSPGVQWGETPLYQTFLEGVDTDWSLPSPETHREYANAPPGERVFRARLVVGETDRDFPVSELAFVVPTPLWLRPSVWAGGTGLLSLFTFVVAHLASQRRARRRLADLERQLERQREMDRERARIARDIHDGLGAGLTQVALMSDLARRRPFHGEEMQVRLDTIYGRARSLTRSVDEIVWAVNPKNDTLGKFIAYIVNDIEDFTRAGDLTLRLRVPDDASLQRPIAAGMRHHLCLAIREILQNVLRHAQASRLDFAVAVSPAALSIEITDDGIGFPTHQPLASDQDGLHNIRTRLAELGGTATIDAQPGSGTRIVLNAPLPPLDREEEG
jgi:signal transduction histidine kinase/streptogramin lyase